MLRYLESPVPSAIDMLKSAEIGGSVGALDSRYYSAIMILPPPFRFHEEVNQLGNNRVLSSCGNLNTKSIYECYAIN